MLMLKLLLLKLQLLWREIYEALYLFHYFHRRITKIGKKHHTTAQVNKKKAAAPEGTAAKSIYYLSDNFNLPITRS